MFILMEAKDYLKEQEFIILGHSTGLSLRYVIAKLYILLNYVSIEILYFLIK